MTDCRRRSGGGRRAGDRIGDASRAVVPLEPTRTTGAAPLAHHDPSFITQLIATAEHMPQTSRLRRASNEDALDAYRCTSEKMAPSAAPRTRQLA